MSQLFFGRGYVYSLQWKIRRYIQYIAVFTKGTKMLLKI